MASKSGQSEDCSRSPRGCHLRRSRTGGTPGGRGGGRERRGEGRRRGEEGRGREGGGERGEEGREGISYVKESQIM